MAETGCDKDDLDWHFECLKTLKGLTSGWSLVHVPALAASVLHALVKLLAVTGGDSDGGSGNSKGKGKGGR